MAAVLLLTVVQPIAGTLLDGAAAPPDTRSAVLRPSAVDVPLAFEANLGQVDEGVRFVARRPGMDLYVTEIDATVALAPAGGPVGANVRLTPVGASPSVRAVGLEPLPGRVNHLSGGDPATWTTNVPTYARVAQQGLYPGIDFHYYGSGGQFEYDVVVAPGADPALVRLNVQGATSLRLGPNGDLLVDTAAGTLTQRRPVSFQDAGGSRVPVASEYVVLGTDEIGFKLGDYDASRPLVIDPTLVYSTFLGGGGIDNIQHIALDSSGNAYVTGNALYNPVPYPTTPGAYDTAISGSGDRDVVVTKMTSAGAMVWSTFIGGTGSDVGAGIAVHSDGTVYVTGNTASANFPTVNAVDTSFNGGTNDSFVSKLSADGSSLLFSTYLGSNGGDQPNTGSITLDSTGAVFTVGQTAQASSTIRWPTTVGAYQTVHAGPNGRADTYVTKLTSAGAMDWSTLIGGMGTDNGFGVAVDATGVYVSGSTTSGAPSQTVFPTTSGAYQTAYGGGNLGDAFVAKFNLMGTALIWSTYIGAADHDTAHALAIDGTGAVYVGGTASVGFPTTAGAFDTTYNLGQDAWVGKLDAAGSQLLYSTFLGTSIGDTITGVAVDGLGSIYVTGSVGATGYPVTADAYDSTYGGGGTSDAILTKIKPAGLGAADLEYSTYIGRATGETGRGPALDSGGNVWIVGATGSSDFPLTPDALDSTYAGTSEGWVMKFSFGAPPDTTPPETTIDVEPSSPWPGASVTFAFSSSEPGSTFECGLDGGGFAACTDPTDYNNVKPGTHTFQVRATDQAGNTDGTPASSTFRVVYPSLPGAVTASTTWLLRETIWSDPFTTIGPFSYGTRPLVPFMGDWDGDGIRTPGTFEGGTFKLRNSNSAGTPDLTFTFGDPRGFVVVADFDGGSRDDVAVFRNGLWQLRITETMATSQFTFGSGAWPATIPLAGDWDGDGTVGIGVYTYTTGAWTLRNTAGTGPADLSFTYTAGAASYPVVGDWNADGTDGIGVKLGTTWSIRESAGAGAPDDTFTFGLANDLPVVWRAPIQPS